MNRVPYCESLTFVEPELQDEPNEFVGEDEYSDDSLETWFDEETTATQKLDFRVHCRYGYHYITCPWSNDECRCGPDTCGCDDRKTYSKATLRQLEECVFRRHMDRMRTQRSELWKQTTSMLKCVGQIQQAALQSGYCANIHMDTVLELIRTSYKRKSNDCITHACIFGIRAGTAQNCSWCPLSFGRRIELCKKARTVRAYMLRFDCVEETIDELYTQQKSRGARKFDKLKTYYVHKPKQSHAPYWDVEKCLEDAKKFSVTRRTQNVMQKLRRATVCKTHKEPKHEVTLAEAIQAHFLVEPQQREDGLFSKAQNNPCYVACSMMAEIKRKQFDCRKHFYGADHDHLEDLDSVYERQELDHKLRHAHHPDKLDRQQTWQETYETMLDLMASALRVTGDVMQAYVEVWKWISYEDRGDCVPREKFRNMNAYGVLVFLEMVKRHGLSSAMDTHVFRRSNTYRTYIQHLSSKAQKKVHDLLHDPMRLYGYSVEMLEDDDQFEAEMARGLVEAYSNELEDHIDLVKSELERVRMPAKHDYDKIRLAKLIPYAWHWTNKSSLYVEHTMMKSAVGGGVEAGVKNAMSDPEVQQGLSASIHGAFAPYLDNIMQSISKLEDCAETTTGAFTDLTTKIDKTLETVAGQMTPMFEKIASATGSFGEIGIMLKGMMDKLGSFIPKGTSPDVSWLDLPKAWWESVNVGDVMYLCQLYILYCHCTSKIVKGVLVLLALKHLGILSKVIDCVKWLWNQMKSFVEHTADDDGADTAKDWFEYLSGVFEQFNVKKAAWLSGMLVILLCGVKCDWKTLVTMGKRIMSMLTNMHYVGLGLFGAKRIFEYIQTTFTVVFDYIKENVFGVKPEEKANVGVIGKWAARVKFFITEEGVQLIRTSKDALEEAASLYPQGVELYLQTQKDEKWAGRDMTRLVQQLQKDALIVHNVVFRIKNYTSFRPTLFHVQLVGKPGIGKSTLTSAMVTRLKNQLFPSYPDQNLVYTLSEAEHFDGYTGQLFIIGDDLVRYNDAKHATTIIGLITNTPVLLPMAHLEDKGTYLDSEIMISSVNNAYPDIKDVLCLDALRRRRHVLVDVEIDPDVVNTSVQKYDDALWKAKYKEEQRHEFPHLKFSLLKPVPDYKEKYEKGELPSSDDPEATTYDPYYYSKGEALPVGLTMPLCNLSFDVFMSKVESRYRAMRDEEKRILPEEKRKRMQQDWEEIDGAIDAAYGGNPTSKFLRGMFLPPEIPLGGTQEQEQLANDINDGKKSAKPFCEQANALWKNDIEPALQMIVEAEVHPPPVFDETDVIEETMDEQSTSSTSPRIKTAKEASEDFVTAADPDEENLSSIEMKRRARILKARGKFVSERAEQVDGTPVKEAVKMVNGKPMLLLREQYEELIALFYNRSSWSEDKKIKFEQQRHDAFCRQRCKMWGDTGIYPRKDSAKVKVGSQHPFTAATQDRVKDLTVHFVRKLVRHEGEWYYDMSELERAFSITAFTKGSLRGDGENMIRAEVEAQGLCWDGGDWIVILDDSNHPVVCSLGHLLLADLDVQDQIHLFLDALTLEQQQALVQQNRTFFQLMGEAFWRKTNMPAVRSWLNETFRKIRHFGRWFWETFIAEQRWTITVFVTVIVTAWCRAIGEVFTPDPVQETSKVLFKGRGNRPLIGIQHTSEQLEDRAVSIVKRNLVKLGTLYGTFAGVKSGQYIYTVAHALRKTLRDNVPFVLQYLPTACSDKMWEVMIKPEQVSVYPESDLAVIYSPNISEARNIDEWFVEEKDIPEIKDATVAHCYFNALGGASIVARDPRQIETHFEWDNGNGYSGTYNWVISMDSCAVAGSSGGPILTSQDLDDGKKVIIGLQSMNKRPHAYAQGVTREMLSYCKEKIQYERKPTCILGPCFVDETLESKAAQHIVEHLDVVGGLSTEHLAGSLGKTKFVKTILAGEFTTTRTPAILNKGDYHVPQGEHPLKHSINKFGRDVMKILPQDLLDRAIEDIALYTKAKIGFPALRTLSFEECIVGHDHPGSGSINTSTSMGLPYVTEKWKGKPKGKKAYIQIDEEGNATVDSRVSDEFEYLDASFRQGVVPPTSMYEFPKDELRPKDKALGIGGPIKTRSISVMNVGHALLFRKYNLDLTAHMHVAADGTFQSCVGINPEGPEWIKLFDGLMSKSSQKCFDLDVGNWDGHFTPQLFFAVVKTVNKIYGTREDSEDATARYAIAHAALFGYDQFEDVVVKKCRGMPSGFGGTAIYNTLGHMLLFYVWWLLRCQAVGKKNMMNMNAYLSCVSVYFYGDDVVCSVDENVAEWFNATTVADLYSSFGWPTTSAAKDGSIRPFQSIWDIQFLKRKFVLDEEYGLMCVHGKIDESVIDDLLVWMRVNSRTVCDEQLMENINSSFQFAFAYGRNTYEDRRHRVNKVLSKRGKKLFYVSYDQMREAMLAERFGMVEM